MSDGCSSTRVLSGETVSELAKKKVKLSVLESSASDSSSSSSSDEDCSKLLFGRKGKSRGFKRASKKKKNCREYLRVDDKDYSIELSRLTSDWKNSGFECRMLVKNSVTDEKESIAIKLIPSSQNSDKTGGVMYYKLDDNIQTSDRQDKPELFYLSSEEGFPDSSGGEDF